MKVIDNSHYSLRFSVYFGAVFLPFGIYIPYFGVWLKDLGMSAQDISLVLAVPLITRVIFTPIMSALADKFGDRRLTLRIYCSLYALTFGLVLLSDHLVWILATLILSNIFMAAIVPLSDSLAMAGVRRFNLDYGGMRLWGSAAFIIANLGGGAIIEHWTASSIIWILVIANLIQALLSLFLPRDPRIDDGAKLTKGARMDWQQLKQFVQPGFWVVLSAIALLQSSHGLLYTFGTIYWQELGISSQMIGILWASSVLVEIALFRFASKVRLLRSWKVLILLSALGSILRWALMPLDLPDLGFLVLQMAHCFSFAASHLGIVYFVAEMVDDELSGTAQGLQTTLVGLGMAISTYISGDLYANYGGNAFLAMAALGIIALILIASLRFFPLERIVAE